MSFKDIQIQFKDFDPSESLRHKISLIAEELYFLAPSDSLLKLTVHKLQKKFKVRIKIASSTGHFGAETEDVNLERATQWVREQVHKQIDRWRSSRFSSPENVAS